MISATRDWFKRNRTTFAVGASVLGAGYVATQYVVSKITEARQRMSDERIAKENLRRRFSQNQEDCAFTVLAILPTATENILQTLPVEATLAELQRKKAERLAKSVGAPTESDAISTVPSLTTDTNIEDGNSTVAGSFIHASQVVGNNGSVGAPKSEAERTADAAATPSTPSAPPKPRKSKLQLWNEVKIDSIARAFSLLYTLALLTLLTRIQLNLLGRRTYLASVVSLASPSNPGAPHINLENRDDDNYEQSYGNDFETNRKYLGFSWWLLHRGCKSIISRVTAAVQEVFDPINPRDDLTLARLSELTLEVRRKVEGATPAERRSTKWLSYLLPPSSSEALVLTSTSPSNDTANPPTISPSLRRLLDETSDLIDSPPFTRVLTLLLDTAFSHLIDTKLSTQSYHLPPVSPSPARIQELIDPETAKAKVANSLAVFCRQAHAIGAGESGNEYLSKMEGVRELEAFAAVVYSSNFSFESARVGGDETLLDVGDRVPGVESRPGAEALEDEDFVDLGTSRPNTAEYSNSDTLRDGMESVWENANKLVKDAEEPALPGESAVHAPDAAKPSEPASQPVQTVSEADLVTEVEEETLPAIAPQEPVTVTAAEEPASAAPEGLKADGASLETAWEKALKREDGKTE